MEVDHVITVTLSASLATYLSGHDTTPTGQRSFVLAAANWTDTVHEIRSRFSRLGDHLFEESGWLRSGLLAAVNDVVGHHADGPPDMHSGDHLFLFTQIAGG
jgi:hypothetical protein